MKKFLTIAVIALASLQSISAAWPLHVATYNIRYHNGDDEKRGDLWQNRCRVITDLINFQHPDVFGAQEVLAHQLDDMLGKLDNYGYIGVGRDDGKKAGEYAAIFYDKDVIALEDDGHFWLSETPEQPGLGWDAACIRICTWGRFRDMRTDSVFYFFNLHTDHVGTVARREAAKLVVDRIKKLADGKPVILTGDFNVDQNDSTYKIFVDSGVLKDSYEAARLRYAENGTFNSFSNTNVSDSRIDHVFVSPGWDVDRYGVLTEQYWTDEGADGSIDKGRDAPDEIGFRTLTPRLPSDHYPVFVRLQGRN